MLTVDMLAQFATKLKLTQSTLKIVWYKLLPLSSVYVSIIYKPYTMVSLHCVFALLCVGR